MNTADTCISNHARAGAPNSEGHDDILTYKLHAILKSVAPDAQEMIKWGNPFFVEPRFLFAFSTHKAHLSFAPSPETLEAFRDDLKQHKTTKNSLQIPYSEPVPDGLIRKIAEYRLQTVSEREDDSFW